MNIILRIFVSVFSMQMLLGCSTPVEYVPIKNTPLQDPPLGLAIVYLLRSPYDEMGISVYIDGKAVAILPPSTYTAIAVPPGKHKLSSVWDAKVIASRKYIPDYDFEVDADKRYFLNLPAQEKRYDVGYSAAAIAPGVLIPIASTRGTPTEMQQAWAAATERDAQWYMNYAKPVLPTLGAL